MNEKAHFIDRVNREMEEDLQPPALSPREALAEACRILAREGHESGLAGQVTARAEQPSAWWTFLCSGRISQKMMSPRLLHWKG